MIDVCRIARARRLLPALALLAAVAGPGRSVAQERAHGSDVADTTETRILDPDDSPAANIRLGDHFGVGGRAEVQYRTEQEFDLSRSIADEFVVSEPVLSMTGTYHHGRAVSAEATLRYSKQIPFRQEGHNDRDRPGKLKVTEALITLGTRSGGTILRLGRQRYDDDREWLCDYRFDAARLTHYQGPWSLEAITAWEGVVGDDLLNERPVGRVDDYLVRLRFRPGERNQVAAYALYRHDHSEEEDRPFLIGLQSKGRIGHNLHFWSQTAHSRGHYMLVNSRTGQKTRVDFQGEGVDVGMTYRFHLPYRPTIVLAWAYGEGDRDKDEHTEGGFHQSGLQDNSNKLAGVTSVEYYGELFEPELSNMKILTLGVGFRLHHRTSLELLHYRYRQHHVSSRIRDASLDMYPNGVSGDLGSEWDLVLGCREFADLEIQALVGWFRPGNAFSADHEQAYLSQLLLRHDF
jgi:alginate production protein